MGNIITQGKKVAAVSLTDFKPVSASIIACPETTGSGLWFTINGIILHNPGNINQIPNPRLIHFIMYKYFMNFGYSS